MIRALRMLAAVVVVVGWTIYCVCAAFGESSGPPIYVPVVVAIAAWLFAGEMVGERADSMRIPAGADLRLVYRELGLVDPGELDTLRRLRR